MPMVWDLIEPYIKGKRYLPLPRRYTLSLASLSPSDTWLLPWRGGDTTDKTAANALLTPS